MSPLRYQDQIVREHRTWLSQFDAQHLRFWELSLKSDPEAAFFEACARQLISDYGYTVEPNADLKGKATGGAERRPDFKCSHNKGHFYVEATCISIATATDITKLSHELSSEPTFFGLLSEAVFNKAWDKTQQFEKVDGPTLLAVGTFHTSASRHSLSRRCADELLTGRGQIYWNVDTRTGAAVGNPWHGTNLDLATFIKPKDCSIRNARTLISGIVLCGFGWDPPIITGILHPNPDYPFDRTLLPSIVFGEQSFNFSKGEIISVWPDQPKPKVDLTELPEWRI